MSEVNFERHLDDHQLTADEKDALKLAELGYSQELKRSWGGLLNFGISFSIISIITGVTGSFEVGLILGGPGVMSAGWIIVSFMTMFVAASMAEIVSAVPTSGGPYHWAALLAPPKYSAFAAWMTGWSNFLGQVAVTTSITFSCATLIATLATAHGWVATPGKTVAIFVGLIVSHGVINTFGVRVLGVLNRISIVLHSLGVFGLALAVVIKAPTHLSAKEVFSTFYDGTGGWATEASPAYVAITGILLAQYSISGYDASAHMSEETHNAAIMAPRGVITSVGTCCVFGWFFLLCLLFSIQDFANTVASPYGQPVLQIYIDVFGLKGATGAIAFTCICVYLCGLFSITANSRMFYAFSRDGGLPKFFDHVDPRLQSPTRAVWLAVVLATLLTFPSLGSAVAYAASTAISTVGLYLSYGYPILILCIRNKEFKRGPWNLGRFSRPVAAIAVLWIIFITIVFCLPQGYPVTKLTLNYAPVALGILLTWSLGSWFLWANKWFKGPRHEALQDAMNQGAAIATAPTSEKNSVKEDAMTSVEPASS